MAEMVRFNVDDGYLEAVCRGYRSAFLTPENYRRLGLADTLEDLRSALEETDYGVFMREEPTPLAVPTFAIKCREKLAHEFQYIRDQAGTNLGKFLDYIRIDKMIDNVMGLIQGSLNKKQPHELLARLDPLGWFPEMQEIAHMDITASCDELYSTLLIDTPVGPYFEKYLQLSHSSVESHSLSEVATILRETDMEVMRYALKKAWLEEFFQYVRQLGGTTAEVMTHILKREADLRVLAVTLNSFQRSLGSASQLQDRNSLYPNFGYLYPEGTEKVRKVWQEDGLAAAIDSYPVYANLVQQCISFYADETMDHTQILKFKTFEDLAYAEVVTLSELAFERQFHYGIFYAWIKLREQEIRNILWIADMILLNKKENIDSILHLFPPKV